ncbi:hypothetical protein D3C71_2020060 [compost metagenome]
MGHVSLSLYFCTGVTFFDFDTIGINCGTESNRPYPHTIVICSKSFTLKTTDEINTKKTNHHLVDRKTQHISHR